MTPWNKNQIRTLTKQQKNHQLWLFNRYCLLANSTPTATQKNERRQSSLELTITYINLTQCSSSARGIYNCNEYVKVFIWLKCWNGGAPIQKRFAHLKDYWISQICWTEVLLLKYDTINDKTCQNSEQKTSLCCGKIRVKFSSKKQQPSKIAQIFASSRREKWTCTTWKLLPEVIQHYMCSALFFLLANFYPVFFSSSNGSDGSLLLSFIRCVFLPLVIFTTVRFMHYTLQIRLSFCTNRAIGQNPSAAYGFILINEHFKH